MALDTNLVLSVSLVDGQGTRANATGYGAFDSTGTVADLKTALAAYTNAIDGVTDGNIVEASARIVVPVAPNAGKAAALAASLAVLTGVFDFRNTENIRLWGLAVPTFHQGYVQQNAINNAATNVAAMITLLSTAATPASFTDNQWQQLGALARSFPTTRKHGNRKV